MQECPNFPEDLRAEQCAKYNGRNYKGRSYVWVPFVDGEPGNRFASFRLWIISKKYVLQLVIIAPRSIYLVEIANNEFYTEKVSTNLLHLSSNKCYKKIYF